MVSILTPILDAIVKIDRYILVCKKFFLFIYKYFKKIKAKDKNISYFFMLIPSAMSVNLSYMFPSATPSNAIVFGVGHIKIKDMVNKIKKNKRCLT